MLLSKSKLNLFNYTSHDITQDQYHETAISPMGDNCLLFSLELVLVLNSGLKNFFLYITHPLLNTEILMGFSGMRLLKHFQYLHLTLFGPLLITLKPQAIHTGLMRDGGMEIKPQIVRISAGIESSGKVPELQFSDSLPGDNFCARTELVETVLVSGGKKLRGINCIFKFICA